MLGPKVVEMMRHLNRLFNKACRLAIMVLDTFGAVIIFLLLYAAIFIDWNL